MHGKSCPVCQHDTMSIFFEIEDLPVHCNLLCSSRDAALKVPQGDIRLGFCQTCSMIYNVSFDTNRMSYTEGYETSLHFSPHFQSYISKLASRLINKYDLYGKDIIEIGCGKGEFLSILCEEGQNRGIGFDASYNDQRAVDGTTQRLTFIHDFYSEAYEDYKADLVCCRHVLEHIESPDKFLLKLHAAIRDPDETVVFFEVPNALYTLRDFGIWDIIYEHCSYFTTGSLSRIFTNTGYQVSSVSEEYGGQFLCIEAKLADGVPPQQPKQQNQAFEIANLVFAFSETYRKKVEEWSGILKRLFEDGSRIVVWGAGSKGVTFLNTLNVTDLIEYVVDMNPHKQGKFLPGSGQRVIPPSFLKSYQPNVIIVMNSIYRNEIEHIAKSFNVTPEFLLA